MAEIAPASQSVPLPVRHALEALARLRKTDPALADQVMKYLPSYALRLQKQRKQFTVDILLETARKGPSFFKPLRKNSLRKLKIRTYESLAKRLNEHFYDRSSSDAEEDPYSGLDLQDELREACEQGDLDRVKKCRAAGADLKQYGYSLIQRASYQGHLNIIEYLYEQKAYDQRAITISMNSALSEGYLDILKYFVSKGRSLKRESKYLLAHPALVGSTDMIKYLHARKLYNQESLDLSVEYAARGGHLETLQYLHSLGANLSAAQGAALNGAAKNGHVEVVKYLIENGVKANTGNSRALRSAIDENNIETVSLLVKHGANVNAYNNYAYSKARNARKNRTALMWILHKKDPSFFNDPKREEELKDIKNYELGLVLWQKTLGIDPPDGLHNENPAYYKKDICDAVVKMLGHESYHDAAANKMAFAATALFGSEQIILQYLNRWGKKGFQPLHDVIQMIKIPREGTPNLTAWAKAVMTCGPTMAKLVKFSGKLSSPLRSKNNKTWSVLATRAELARDAFKQAAKNPNLSVLCFEYDRDEEDFEDALELIQKSIPQVKNIPDLKIPGDKFGMSGAIFRRLEKDDIRGLFLGEMTDCCQSLNDHGHECAVHGFTSENGGFYVVEDDKEKIIGMTWAWRGTNGEMCLDSLETLGNDVKKDQWEKILDEMANILRKNKTHDVTALTVGFGGKTPRSLKSRFNEMAKPAKPVDYRDYRDSHNQLLVWERSKKKINVPSL